MKARLHKLEQWCDKNTSSFEVYEDDKICQPYISQPGGFSTIKGLQPHGSKIELAYLKLQSAIRQFEAEYEQIKLEEANDNH